MEKEVTLGDLDMLDHAPWARGLTYQQSLYVLAYTGNNKAACKKIGVSPKLGLRWQKSDKVRYALQQRLLHDIRPELVASADERKAWWTQIMREADNPMVPLANRLKASELLGRSEGDFGDDEGQGGPTTVIVNTGVPDATKAEEQQKLEKPAEVAYSEEDDY